jgi:hypothetical protein
MSNRTLLAVVAASVVGLGLDAATPTLDLTLDRAQTLSVGGAAVALDGEFKDGFWTYGKKGISIPAAGLVGRQGTILFRFKVSEFREEPMKARYLLVLRDAGRVFLGPYMLADGKKLFVAVCDYDRDVKDYPVISEDIRKGESYTFAAAWDGNTLRLYLNGLLVEERKQKFPMPEAFRTLNLGPYIDNWTNPPPWGDDSHAGALKTFNVALSSAEIAALSGAQGHPLTDDHPQMLTVGKIDGAAPVVDGDLSDKAWQTAGGMIAFTDGRNGPLTWAQPPSSFLLSYDDTALYFGLKTLFPGRVPIKEGALRDANETDVWGSESFELYLQVNGAVYRFGGNVAGGYVEGKDLDTTYSGPWTYKSGTRMRIDDRRLWHAEAAIPWSSFGLSGPPTAPIKFNVGRSWFLPDTSTWSALTPDGQYQTVATFPALVFAPATAALQVLEQNDPSGGRFRQSFQVASARAGEAQYQILLAKKDSTAVPLPLHQGNIAFKAGVPTAQELDLPIVRPGFDSLVFTLSEGGKAVLCQVVPFRLNEEYIEVKPSFLKSTVELRTKIEQLKGKFGADFKGRLIVTGPAGAVVAQVDAADTGVDRIPFPRTSAAGTYTAELLNAKDGARVDSRTFSYPGVGEWEKLSFDNRVIPPFTPLVAKAGAGALDVSVWGRSCQWDRSLLPTQIVTQGEKLLAAPAMIEIDGAPLPAAEFTIGASAPHRIEFTAVVKTDAYELTETAWMEYDGVQHGAFTLKALKDLKGVKVKVTLPGERVAFLHTSYDYGWGAKRTETVAKGYQQTFRFYPSVWLGDYEKGLCIFAESNATWKSESNSAATLTHDGVTAVYTATLANELKAGATLPFDLGFLASPVRPLPKNYPLNTFSDQFSAKMNRPGRRPTAYFVLADSASVGLGGFFCDLPTPETSPNAPITRRYIEATRERGAKGAPYMMARFLSEEYPEVAAFKNTWRISPEQTLDYEQQGKKCYVTEICAFSSGSDFFMWKLKDYLKRIPSDGIYYDFGLPPWCNNAEHGCASHSTMLGNREFLRRTALCLLDSGVEEPLIVLHNTDSVMLPSFTFATHLFNGENIRQHSSTLMHNGKDLLDSYDVVKFASELSSLPFGYTNSVYHAQDLLLPEFGGTNEDPDLYKFRLTKAVITGAIVHNTLPSISRLHFGIFDKIVRIYDAFGVPEATFLGYWRQPATVKAGKDIYVSLYRQAGGAKALAVISHIGKEHITQDLEIQFDAGVTGLKPFTAATEMLTAPDPDYEVLAAMVAAVPAEYLGGPQVYRTPVKLGDFGCRVTGIKDNVLKLRLAYHSFALVELQ